MIRRFLGAAQMLTVVPIHVRTATPAESAAFFPLVGALLGLCGAGLLKALSWALPPGAAALGVVLFWVLVTGALHEDGLADCADAFRAHRSPDIIHEILKDSRIGAFGALALIFSIGLRWQALTSLATPALPLLVASQTVSRAALVALAWISRPAGDGLGAQFCTRMSTWSALAAVVIGVGAAIFCGLRLGWVIIGLTTLLVFGARRYFQARIGGVTGDCLGALSQVVETAILLVGSCANCSW
jgi:adenosylcobinamide-GDP ribazoletransferase